MFFPVIGIIPILMGGAAITGKLLGIGAVSAATGATILGVGKAAHSLDPTKDGGINKDGYGAGFDKLLGRDQRQRAMEGTFNRQTGELDRGAWAGLEDWVLGHDPTKLKNYRQTQSNNKIKREYSTRLANLNQNLPEHLKGSLPTLENTQSREDFAGELKGVEERVQAMNQAVAEGAFGGVAPAQLPTVSQSGAALTKHERTRPGGVEQTRLRQEYQVNKQNANANKIAALGLANNLVMNQRNNQLQLQLADMQYQDRRLERDYRRQSDRRKDKLAMMAALMGGLSNSARMLY